ncbi:MAG: EamA family transporter [Desulfobacteraceae bacterium]|nr:EamA family transporter [Desulfobacteraceae bacterium]
MKVILAILFASTAAFGNAMFALGQRNSVGVKNGVFFVGISAMVAVILAFIFAPMIGALDVKSTIEGNWKAALLSGIGLFFTYLGFNLLYTRCGVTHYILYAVLSIITTTIVIGILWLKESVNIYQIIAIGFAIVAVVLFSIGQSKI